MDWISSPLVTVVNAFIGLALLLSFNRAFRLAGLWLMSQVACDAMATGVAIQIDATQTIIYYYMIACSGLILSLHVYRYPYRYTSLNYVILFVASVVHLVFGFYKHIQLNHWLEWGESAQAAYGALIDSSFFLSSMAVDITLVLLGVYSAMVPPASYNNIDPYQ